MAVSDYWFVVIFLFQIVEEDGSLLEIGRSLACLLVSPKGFKTVIFLLLLLLT